MPPPVIALDPDAAEQGSDNATFQVVRVGPPNTAPTVEYVPGGEAPKSPQAQVSTGKRLVGKVVQPKRKHFTFG